MVYIENIQRFKVVKCLNILIQTKIPKGYFQFHHDSLS